ARSREADADPQRGRPRPGGPSRSADPESPERCDAGDHLADLRDRHDRAAGDPGALMGRLFGTDGIRGVANVDLTSTLAYDLGRAVGHLLQASGEQVVIGQDTRRSGDML